MATTPSYIIAARRTVNGRIGGLHRNRRIEELSAPIIEAALKDARLGRRVIDEVIIGNSTDGNNPARLIALAAGLSEDIPAYTIDRQCASGLEAVLSAVRLIGCGGAHIILSGGAESPSTAPWRVTKPKSVHQLPRFFESSSFATGEGSASIMVEAAEIVAKRYKINRHRQDNYALASHLKAISAQDDKRFNNEIVPVRIDAKEARDETPRSEISPELLAQMPVFITPDGTVTSGNSGPLTDGASFLIAVSEDVYKELGSPSALKVVCAAATGIRPELTGVSPVKAVQKLMQGSDTIKLKDVSLIELSETFAAHALASISELGLEEGLVNKDGGAISLGHPLGASSSMLITRLFSRMVRHRESENSPPEFGLAALGAAGGLGVAALFQAV